MNLHNPPGATMEAGPAKACKLDDATGFIRPNTLRLKVAAKVQSKKAKLMVAGKQEWLSARYRTRATARY